MSRVYKLTGSAFISQRIQSYFTGSETESQQLARKITGVFRTEIKSRDKYIVLVQRSPTKVRLCHAVTFNKLGTNWVIPSNQIRKRVFSICQIPDIQCHLSAQVKIHTQRSSSPPIQLSMAGYRKNLDRDDAICRIPAISMG